MTVLSDQTPEALAALPTAFHLDYSQEAPPDARALALHTTLLINYVAELYRYDRAKYEAIDRLYSDVLNGDDPSQETLTLLDAVHEVDPVEGIFATIVEIIHNLQLRLDAQILEKIPENKRNKMIMQLSAAYMEQGQAALEQLKEKAKEVAATDDGLSVPINPLKNKR